MTTNWRDELRHHPKVVELENIRSQRRLALNKDKKFVLETEALIKNLEGEYARNPHVVADIFQRFRFPIPAKLPKIKSFLKQMEDNELRQIFERYVRYASRFNVFFVLRKKKPHFRCRMQVPSGTKFHVKIVKGTLTALKRPSDDAPYIDSFESDKVDILPQLDNEIKLGRAKFVRIDDSETSSLLSLLESFAYFPEGITFVIHHAEKDYLMCLIGEQVTNDIWRKASKSVSAILRKHYERGTAGRPRDLKKRAKALALLKTPGSLKDKATHLTRTETDLPTQVSYLSRLGRETK